MLAMASQITSLPIVYPTVCSGADKRKHQSSAPLAFVVSSMKIAIVIVHFVQRSTIDHRPTLMQTVAWCQTDNKLLSESMMAYNDVIMSSIACEITGAA